MSDADMQALDAYFGSERMRHLEEYRAFLRIPSVSALPAHREDMVRAAEWVANGLRSVGVPTVEILPTGGHPVVYGGLAPNPLNALTTMLGSMWTLDGQVQIEGYFEEVRPLSEQEKAEIAAIPFDDAWVDGVAHGKRAGTSSWLGPLRQLNSGSTRIVSCGMGA